MLDVYSGIIFQKTGKYKKFDDNIVKKSGITFITKVIVAKTYNPGPMYGNNRQKYIPFIFF